MKVGSNHGLDDVNYSVVGGSEIGDDSNKSKEKKGRLSDISLAGLKILVGTALQEGIPELEVRKYDWKALIDRDSKRIVKKRFLTKEEKLALIREGGECPLRNSICREKEQKKIARTRQGKKMKQKHYGKQFRGRKASKSSAA